MPCCTRVTEAARSGMLSFFAFFLDARVFCARSWQAFHKEAACQAEHSHLPAGCQWENVGSQNFGHPNHRAPASTRLSLQKGQFKAPSQPSSMEGRPKQGTAACYSRPDGAQRTLPLSRGSHDLASRSPYWAISGPTLEPRSEWGGVGHLSRT